MMAPFFPFPHTSFEKLCTLSSWQEGSAYKSKAVALMCEHILFAMTPLGAEHDIVVVQKAQKSGCTWMIGEAVPYFSA